MQTSKPPLILLCHRIPFPPDKGDKIRSYHLLIHLAQKYDVYLGAFIDDASDWQYTDHLEKICKECRFINLNKRTAKFASLGGLVTGKALTLPYYQSRELHKWVDSLRNNLQDARFVAFSSPMAQYGFSFDSDAACKIVDLVDLDSDKWRQFAAKKNWPISWLYAREARYLLAFEKKIATYFDASLFVSKHESNLFKTISPLHASKIDYYNNGVDSQYFSTQSNRQNPYSHLDKVIVFTGVMDYWPNVDAVKWFVQRVFPGLRTLDPTIRFFIVGSSPASEVSALGSIDGVEVTGRVDDVRPYLQYAKAAVAPMRIARGIQNKVLEAMSMELPVIVSDMGVEGIEAESGKELLVAHNSDDYEQAIVDVLSGQYECMGEAARHFVVQQFSWSENLARLDAVLQKQA